MSEQYSSSFTIRLLLAALPIAFVGASASAVTAKPKQPTDPMSFFEGRTESLSMIKVIAKKPFRSRSLGRGVIGPDGTLNLIQRVVEDGKAPYERRWQMRQVAPGRFIGTMTEASGPVVAEEIDGRFRFRFKMKGHLSIEQWLTPLPGGEAAQSKVSIRKFGMKVGSSDGTIRKL
jgi:hypothetical protein